MSRFGFGIEEEDYDNLFNADNRNEEAGEYSAWWYNDVYENKHKITGMDDQDYFPIKEHYDPSKCV